MRRVLFVLLAAVPALAVGQSMSSTTTTINIAQCNGAQPDPDDLKLGDKMNADISWTVKLNDSATVIPTDGSAHYVLYAAAELQAAGESDSDTTNLCSTNKNGTTVGGEVNLKGTSDTEITASDSSGSVSAQEYALQDIASTAGIACTGSGSQTVYLCAQLFIDDQVEGYAKGTLTLDRRVPAAPTSVTSTPGDGKLHLSCQAGEDGAVGTSAYKATAALGGTVVSRSNRASSCGDLVIGGLTNTNQYTVTVYALSSANNPGAGSSPLSDVSTTPIPTNDYWDHYDGQEQGGCSTSGTAAGLAGALALLAGLSLLAALRRRNS